MRRKLRVKFAAARHEIDCEECRGSWLAWVQRLVGLPQGYAPCNRRILRTVQDQRDAAIDERDRLRAAITDALTNDDPGRTPRAILRDALAGGSR